MDIQFVDFNAGDVTFAERFASRWDEVANALSSLPLHLKDSDQAGRQGSLIFDPVGTNFAIKHYLQGLGWAANVPVPGKFSFLGTDVDFVRDGVLIEVQFSNYPFLLNNAVRAELLYKSREHMAGGPIEALVVIAKAHMFPASNSTLYYEQAIRQLTELSRNEVLEIPIRVVGLFSPVGTVEVHHTGYHAARYSRTVVTQDKKSVQITRGRGANSRSSLRFI